MVARLKPQKKESLEQKAASIVDAVTRHWEKPLTEKERKLVKSVLEPAQQSMKPNTPHTFVGFSKKVTNAFKIGPLQVSYRTAENATSEQRRYYLGHIQIAYLRIRGGQYFGYSYGSDPHSLRSIKFASEKKFNDWLLKELKGE